MKTCNGPCGGTKPESEFGARNYKNGQVGLRSMCRTCNNSAKNTWTGKNKVRDNERNKHYNKANAQRIRGFKLQKYWPDCSPEQCNDNYQALLIKQNFLCACCGESETSTCPGYKTRSLAVDHIHGTNVVRGLVCNKCNRGIGLLGDTQEGLLKAIKYLSQTPTSVPIIKAPLEHPPGVCHQKLRRDATEVEDRALGFKFDLLPSDFIMESERMTKEHIQFIERYEWLGKVGWAVKWCFTARHEGKLAAVVLMSEPTMATKYKIYEALIQRGAAASWAPKNLNSKLVMFSCRWMVNNTGKRLFTCYSDPAAGEIGTIYQACNFMYLGRGWGVKSGLMLPTGKVVSKREFTKTSAMKRWAKELGIPWQKEWCKPNGYQDVKAYPPDIKNKLLARANEEVNKYPSATQESKGKYALVLGKDRREEVKLKKIIVFDTFPYPKRDKSG